ncbi:Inner membrane protein YohD [Posidoniimonas polymericola]|uniref:Inner membrane protein YohD n=1 Tax=Posidoniimonas polymericola TaxID=2528002 RepID=A0A5C5ZD72_9BACT|nr:DedA family protein [Posidoniimonas polymericola]TWT85272.1 Inner membrane protein YohD [Posidoniimonas polymericola]
MILDFLVKRVGLWGIFAFLALTGVGVPIPEEAPLVLAGVLSKAGRFDPFEALAFCLMGALVGDSIMYAIGRHLGHAFLLKHPLISRFVNAEEEEKLEHVIQKHGFKILLGTRFLIGIRGAVYFAAGAARVPYLRFLLWDLVAASLVVLIVFGLGYLFGPWIEPVIGDAEKLVTVIVVAVLIGVGYMLYRKRVERIDREIERLERESQNEKLAEGVVPQPAPNEQQESDEQQDRSA